MKPQVIRGETCKNILKPKPPPSFVKTPPKSVGLNIRKSNWITSVKVELKDSLLPAKMCPMTHDPPSKSPPFWLLPTRWAPYDRYEWC